MNKLNILNLATEDYGGAGIASKCFNDLFINAGYNSILIVKQSNTRNKNVIVLEDLSSKYSLRWFFRKVVNYMNRLYLKNKVVPVDSKYVFSNVIESKQFYTAKKILKKTPFEPDIIILHWISNFINSKTIKELNDQTKAKLIWIMMDNAPLTGGCHYPWDCKGFELDCSNCPAILNSSKLKIAQDNLTYKKNNLPTNLELITSSESDYRRALKSSIYKTHKIHKILFPVDDNKFKPDCKKDAKAYWGIEEHIKVIFFGSISLIDKRKGSMLFFEALLFLQNKFKDEQVGISNLLILIAGNENQYFIKDLQIHLKKIGYLTEEELIRAYQAADVFVSASIEDSGPLMINQSIMCGTPVVSFEVGVALDLVDTGQTGYRAKLGDVEDLANGIIFVLQMRKNEYLKMSENCRDIGLTLCQPQKQIEIFIECFKTIQEYAK